MAKRFPVIYPMPFGQDQYRKYLNLALDSIEYERYLRICHENILPEKPRVCSKHKSEGIKKPLSDCLDCSRYDFSMITKTVENLVRCGFIIKNKGFVCKKHNKKKKGKEPKPVEGCPECKPYKGNICSNHLQDGAEEPVPGCTNCIQGYVSIKLCLTGVKWLRGEQSYSFSQLVYDNIRRSWGFQLRVPNGLEAIEDILKLFNSTKRATYSGKDIFDLLSEIIEKTDNGAKLVEKRRGGYDFNIASEGSRRSLREILKLLVYMDALKSPSKNVYERGERFSSRRAGLKKADLVYEVEQIIKYIGHNELILESELEDVKLKALMSKYYIYRQTRGIGKDAWYLKNIHKMLFKTKPKGAKIEDSNGRIQAVQEDKILTKRSVLRSEVKEKWKIQDDSLLSVRSLKTLMEIEKAKDFKEVKRILEANKTKFDKSSLDILCHSGLPYTLPTDFNPFDWQSEALRQWENGIGVKEHLPFSGIISVVTGAGKTVMAILGIKRYLEVNPNAKISIIVPTRVLMYQWARELSKYLAIPSLQIGLRGDGFKDLLSSPDVKVQILIVNSAIQSDFLKREIEKINVETKHLLVADECHRYTGSKFQKIFECRHEASLGLSATPLERNIEKEISDEDASYDLVLENNLGPVFYELSYNKALNEKLISEFTVDYIAVDLNEVEQRKYDSLNRQLKSVLEKIDERYGNRIDLMKGDSLDQKLRIILKSDKDADAAIGQYFKLVRERREVLYNSESRKGAYYYLLSKAIHNNKKVIVFHEKIEQLEQIVAPDISRQEALEKKSQYLRILDQRLQLLLYDRLYRPVMYHSFHEKDFWNIWAMDWFRSDVANVMLSVKALIEGVDVPTADVGIVRVSSSSVRQRIQATGRILRRSRSDAFKKSVMYVIFVRNTVDESIFKKYNWREELGSSGIEFHHFVPSINDDELLGRMEQLEISLLPVKRVYQDNRPPIHVDLTNLQIGGPYPGRYIGDEYHVSSDGKPFARKSEGRIYLETDLMKSFGAQIKRLKGGGKFVITPQGSVVTTTKNGELIFLGKADPAEVRAEIQKKLHLKDVLERSKSRPKQSLFDQLFEK